MSYYFEGFDEPNYTQIPDKFFDEVMCHLSEGELRVVLYIMRRTYGFKKQCDPISYSQFIEGIVKQDGERLDHGCGLKSPTHLSRALKGLELKGIIITEKVRDARGGRLTTIYRLRYRQQVLPQSEGGTTRTVVGVLPQAQIQETVNQKTVKQETAISSKISKRSRKQGTGEEPGEQSRPRTSNMPTGREHSYPPDYEPNAEQRRPSTGLMALVELLPDRTQNIASAPLRGPKSGRSTRGTGQPSSRRKSALKDDSGGPEDLPGTAPDASPTPQLDSTVDYLSSKLRDWRHRTSNRTQARNLMDEYRVPEAQMAELLHQAYSRTKEANPDTPMAYCFSVVRQLLQDQPQRRTGDHLLGKWAKYHKDESGE